MPLFHLILGNFVEYLTKTSKPHPLLTFNNSFTRIKMLKDEHKRNFRRIGVTAFDQLKFNFNYKPARNQPIFFI
jgi:hypothetical protein